VSSECPEIYDLSFKDKFTLIACNDKKYFDHLDILMEKINN